MPPRPYVLYGLQLASDWPLPAPPGTDDSEPDVILTRAPADRFREAAAAVTHQPDGREWFRYLPRPGGEIYLRWTDLFEFLVSPDGRTIEGHELGQTSLESLQTYLLGQVLSFALLRQGREPLHATAVLVEKGAIGFLGDSGFGKSTLGAAFLGAGYSLVTDDLLVIEPDGSGGFATWPGPARIKLFPHVAAALLGDHGRGVPMNPDTEKCIIPLDAQQAVAPDRTVPLTALYILAPDEGVGGPAAPVIGDLSAREACLALIANTFNTLAVEPERLTVQFEQTARLAQEIPVRTLAWPRDLTRLDEVREALLRRHP